jgi:HSP20 family protein
MRREDPFQEVEQLLDQFTGLGPALSDEIPVDVLETEESVVVLADLPGREADDIGVRLADEQRLTIDAPAVPEPEGRYVLRSRATGEASRSIRLPSPVREEGTEASYDDGVLEVRLDKPTDEREGTDIEVSG